LILEITEKNNMRKKSNLTPKLRQNWWIDAVLGLSALITILSGIYFLIYPDGGYQGGRNPYYNFRLIFDRHTWNLLHTWSGVLMIMAAVLHIAIHWRWITGTINRTWQVITRKRKLFSLKLTYNILLDAIIAVSFIICALSSLVFLVYPESGRSSETIVFSQFTWDMLHIWSGVVMTITAILHFILHWKWVVNITGKLIGRREKPNQNEAALPTTGETI
jgi:lysylphosphatidylglycerol synthetase-like protein (DUF2156 family)